MKMTPGVFLFSKKFKEYSDVVWPLQTLSHLLYSFCANIESFVLSGVVSVSEKRIAFQVSEAACNKRLGLPFANGSLHLEHLFDGICCICFSTFWTLFVGVVSFKAQRYKTNWNQNPPTHKPATDTHSRELSSCGLHLRSNPCNNNHTCSSLPENFSDSWWCKCRW